MVMRISFDVDDTLVCPDPQVPRETQKVPGILRPWLSEFLRLGTKDLLLQLQMKGWEIWIYTTSYRTERYLKLWLWFYGVSIGGVVNAEANNQELKRRFGSANFKTRPPSKFPPAFGIDLHVDDSEGVGMEAREYGFNVVIIKPTDPNWVNLVLEVADTYTHK